MILTSDSRSAVVYISFLEIVSTISTTDTVVKIYRIQTNILVLFISVYSVNGLKMNDCEIFTITVSEF